MVWWEAGAQPPQMLADGEVVMSTAYNGRIFNAQVVEGQPFEIVWDGQVLDVGRASASSPVRPRNSNRRWSYLKFATRASSMAAVGRYIAYSPVRRSGLPLIGRHAEVGVDMKPATCRPEPAATGSGGWTTRTICCSNVWWADHG